MDELEGASVEIRIILDELGGNAATLRTIRGMLSMHAELTRQLVRREILRQRLREAHDRIQALTCG